MSKLLLILSFLILCLVPVTTFGEIGTHYDSQNDAEGFWPTYRKDLCDGQSQRCLNPE